MHKTIKEVIEYYLNEASNDYQHRYHSWDDCRAAFLRKNKDNYHTLELGFYLASWGMYRGSGGLLQKNHRIHSGAVEAFYCGIFNHLKCSEKIEVNQSHIPSILVLRDMISMHYQGISYIRGNNPSRPISPTDTLISKIMLGTFACVPAYDDFFILGLKTIGIKKRKFDEGGLNALFTFYQAHRPEIDTCQQLIQTGTGKHYPIMKIIDMYFWQVGYQGYLDDLEVKKLEKQALVGNKG